ncbi:MAG: AbrB family transcriptional regulator, partial [Acidiferrobacterales bacterium]
SNVVDRPDLRRTLRTLIYGAVGGAVFYWFNMPLAWMMGAMVATTIMSMTGRRLYVPQGLRAVMVMVLGVLLGSAFTPDVIEQASRWPITLSALLVYIALITAVLYLYFHKVLGYDPVTAYFSATPGGLNEMVIVGAAFHGDDRTIALIHGSRVLLVVLVIPFWFRYTEGIGAGVSFRGPSLLDTSMLDLGVLTLCAVVGAVGARLLRLPAYRIVGPMLATAAIHIAGWTESKPPYELVFIAQVVVGASVGARFAGVPLERVVRTIAASVSSTSVMLVFTFLAALVLVPLTGIPKAPIVLAFAPGGLVEMSVIALSLGIETAFVATHHVARIAMIVIGAPIVFRAARRLRKQKEVAPPPAE